MKEITELKITRQQLAAEPIYYNGCETAEMSKETDKNKIIELAADVLMKILEDEFKKD